MRALLTLACAITLLSGCSSLTAKQPTLLGQTDPTLLGETLPGISDLDTTTRADKADEKWWGSFYNNKAISE